MKLDTAGPRGGGLFSGKTYTVNDLFGQSLIDKGRAVIAEPQRYVRWTSEKGKTKVLSWGDYLKTVHSR